MSTAPNILILATGGTIAGTAGSALKRDYRPGQIGISAFIDQALELGLEVNLTGCEVAAIGSEDITTGIWGALHQACVAAMSDPEVDSIVITHGTDTAEETALLFDLTLPAGKPVILVGAMRPADVVGTDGIRNFLNAVRVASDADAAGRGVMLVMSDRIISARDARKARTSGVDAFKGFPRDAIGTVTPSSLDWFGEPWARGRQARYGFPQQWPHVPICFAHAAMERDAIDCLLRDDTSGLVLAGFGDGNAPQAIFERLAELTAQGIAIVRASRVDEGLIDRMPMDDACGFVAARGLGPAKARILLQVLLANGVRDPETIQRAFDTR